MLNILMIDSGVASHPKLNNAEICRTGFRNQRTAEDITDTVGHGTAVASLILKGTDQENVRLNAIKLFDDEFDCAETDTDLFIFHS